MELQQLRYFREVAEQQHVTRAAEKLFVSQSAVSRAVAQLEQELGVALFHRQNRSIILSTQGKQFLASVIQIQNTLAQSVSALKAETSPDTGNVAFGFIGSLGAEIVPRLIETFRRSWPRVQFTLVQHSGEVLLRRLLDGAVDLCFSVPGIFDEKTLQWQHLLDEELVLAVGRNHRLASRKSIAFKSLGEETFLALSAGRTLRTIFDGTCTSAGFSPNIAFEAMDLTTLRGMVGAGLGVALAPAAYSRFRGVTKIRLKEPRPVRPIGIAWVANRYLPPCSINFRTFATLFFQKGAAKNSLPGRAISRS